ncbi:uncharacterized protein TRAVEDRAFT_117152, partial [Trametes versicolor FP-101664 SS1]|uniref:uncharacterized protein n=1 Tax=Trametes versicolor (strain FP-101664) TaxID=717944 RepID=UPI0004623A1E
VSAFGQPSAPSSFFGQNAAPSVPKATVSGKPDFTAGRARAHASYRPGVSKYDDLLPPNYMELLPKAALEAFSADSDRFDWANIPEWIPPKELR